MIQWFEQSKQSLQWTPDCSLIDQTYVSTLGCAVCLSGLYWPHVLYLHWLQWAPRISQHLIHQLHAEQMGQLSLRHQWGTGTSPQAHGHPMCLLSGHLPCGLGKVPQGLLVHQSLSRSSSLSPGSISAPLNLLKQDASDSCFSFRHLLRMVHPFPFLEAAPAEAVTLTSCLQPFPCPMSPVPPNWAQLCVSLNLIA